MKKIFWLVIVIAGMISGIPTGSIHAEYRDREPERWDRREHRREREERYDRRRMEERRGYEHYDRRDRGSRDRDDNYGRKAGRDRDRDRDRDNFDRGRNHGQSKQDGQKNTKDQSTQDVKKGGKKTTK